MGVLANNVNRGVAIGQDQVVVNLNQGQNEILLKIINYGGVSGFYFALPDKVELIPAHLVDLAVVAESERSEEQKKELRLYYRAHLSPYQALKQIRESLKENETKKSTIKNAIATTLVMAERETPRGAYILHRGDYTKRREP